MHAGLGARALGRSATMKGWAASAVAAGIVAALVVPSAANAQATPVVSQATGRLVTTSLLTTDVLDAVVALRGAVAVNEDGSGDVIVDTPLDAAALAALIQLQAGSTNLFGDNGIIRLGAVGQYAQANDDGSSSGFSGAVSAAPSLIGVGTVTPSDVGAPTAGDTATIGIGGPDSPVSLEVGIGVLAASAQQDTAGVQTGQYVLADAGFTVGGTVLGGVLTTVNPIIDTLRAAAALAGLDIPNPFASGALVLTLDDLLAVAGVPNVNALPPGTDLVSLVPQALADKVIDTVDDILAAVQARVTQLGPLAGATLGLALAAARTAIGGVLGAVDETIVEPLSDALTALVQLQVNVQTTSPEGTFTQTALRVGLGPDGSLASVDLASASVGPNAGELAVPIVGPESAMIAGGGALALTAILGAVLLVRARRRTSAAVLV